jgi:hypothetical protein
MKLRFYFFVFLVGIANLTFADVDMKARVDAAKKEANEKFEAFLKNVKEKFEKLSDEEKTKEFLDVVKGLNSFRSLLMVVQKKCMIYEKQVEELKEQKEKLVNELYEKCKTR